MARSPGQGLRPRRYEAQAPRRPVRRSGDRPSSVRVAHDLQGTVSVEQEAVAAAVRQVGWRVSATKQPADQRTLEQAVRAGRAPSLVERDRGRRTGRPWSLTPLYLERDDHATGLSRLRSVGVRVLTRPEVVVRQRLRAPRTGLAGLSVGNPKRTTARPTSERWLDCLQGLTLTIMREGRRRRSHLTPLSRVQQRLLALLDCSVAVSLRLWLHSHKPP